MFRLLSLYEIRGRIQAGGEAIELYLEVEKDIPKKLNFVGIQKVEVQGPNLES
jgi:hypothetical protein